MAKDCFIEKVGGVVENDSLEHFNSFRVYIPNGSENLRYLQIYPKEVTTVDYYANKNIFTVDGVPTKHNTIPNVQVVAGTSLYPANAVSGLVYVDISPADKIIKIIKADGQDGKSFVDIDGFVNTGIQELEIGRNSYENREIIALGYMKDLVSFLSGRSKYSGSIESVVEKTIENYPTKSKGLVINLFAQADFGGTVTFHGSTLTVALYLEFNGDGTANVYNNTDRTTVIASYNGTTWTYA